MGIMQTERNKPLENLFTQLPRAVLDWYDRGHRDLPWRKDREPYHIWLSEIMLQQTRVEAVKGYYARFLQALPTIADLAACDDEKLQKLWQGLGYYSRVRNLKKAALCIMDHHGGQFPGKYEDILALPGIGEYTAGAVGSIAFELPKAAVDGNVLRLISRLTDDHSSISDPKRKVHYAQALEAVYPQGRCGDFTQALMELGATLCGPNGAPQCDRCPCQGFCLAHHRGTAADLPVRQAKKEKKRQEKTVFVLRCGNRYALRKRPNRGLLAGLWEFPHVEGLRTDQEIGSTVEELGLILTDIERSVERNHIFTHIIWQMRCYFGAVREPGDGFTWLTAEQIEADAALPTAFRQFWEETEHV